MNKSLDERIARILSDSNCEDFILADAKDADMAAGMAAPGLADEGTNREFRTLSEYRELMRTNVQDAHIDIMLMSASSNEVLCNERLFDDSPVTSAVRLNDTTDIWMADGGHYSDQPSRPFRSTKLHHVRPTDGRVPSVDLGLYSVTLNNDVAHDVATLSAYAEFRDEAASAGMRHFLEVFDPNAPIHPIEDVGRFVNDQIARTLAGVCRAYRPLFLKIAYHGPAAMDQLVSYDPSLIVGILGGSSGTTFDAFHQLWEAKKYGARAALYGRMINNSEDQSTFIQHLRWIADGELNDPTEATRSYHAALERKQIVPLRSLDNDLQQTRRYSAYG